MKNIKKYIKYIPYAVLIVLLFLFIRAEYINNMQASMMEKIAIEAENEKIAREKAEAPFKLLESFQDDRKEEQKWIDTFKSEVKKYEQFKYQSEMKIRCQRAFLIGEHKDDCSKKENFERFPL